MERLIGTVRREFLDHLLFWNSVDLKRKLSAFEGYYNATCVHASLNGNTPMEVGGQSTTRPTDISHFAWPSKAESFRLRSTEFQNRR